MPTKTSEVKNSRHVTHIRNVNTRQTQNQHVPLTTQNIEVVTIFHKGTTPVTPRVGCLGIRVGYTRGDSVIPSLFSYVILLEQTANNWTRILLPFDERKHIRLTSDIKRITFYHHLFT